MVISQTSTHPVFVIGAPLSGAGRVAAWLGQHGQARMLRLIQASGPEWARDSDRLHISDDAAATVRQGLATQQGARIETHPAIALNVDVIATVFPRARFLFLYRDVREHLARMLNAWDAQRYVHPSGVHCGSHQPWCLNLPQNWSSVAHWPVDQIVAWQWVISTQWALNALAALPAERWAIASFDRLLSDGQGERLRLTRVLGLPTPATSPVLARVGEQSPALANWQGYGERIAALAPLVAAQADRAVKLFAERPNTRAQRSLERSSPP
ncbi:hypothetical protein C7S18_11120 [Ahniella affigens]|uniref:Sulfotransferase family protein n=2 Tax=Ahniella affigens TaxID=2021234 RepID=A0A2P1PSA8_9GAMM|nr:hypothetical protein C7S18_11120 [Ahniella affigens]